MAKILKKIRFSVVLKSKTRKKAIIEFSNCPCCGQNNWKEIKLLFMNNYLICEVCSLNIQRLPTNISKNEFFIEQQKIYFSESSFKSSLLMEKIENEQNMVRVKKINQYLKKPCSVMEVGAGSGSFAKKIESLGFNLTIVEQSQVLAERLRKSLKAEVINKDLSQLSKQENIYEAIFSFHVIEHIADLKGHIEDMASLLKSGGLVFLATPSANSFEHKLPLALSPNYDSAHLYVLSKNSLEFLIEDAGLELIEIFTPEYSSGWLKVASKMLRRLRRKSEIETAGVYISESSLFSRVIFSLFFVFSIPFRFFQSFIGRGNEIFLVARKK